MSGAKSLVIVVLLGALTTQISGQCGFPGNPLSGEVYNADTLKVVESSDVLNGTVLYQCEEGLSISGDSQRHCVDGVWTGSIPICVNVENIDVERALPLSGEKSYLQRGNCFDVMKKIRIKTNTTDTFQAVRLTVANASISRMQSVNWTVDNKKYQSNLTIERVRYDKPNETLLVFDNRVNVPVLELKTYRSAIVCSIELQTVPSDCGYPEIPIDGQVELNNRTAIYQCNEGFELKSSSAKRQCVDGKWTGPVPVCTRIGTEIATESIEMLSSNAASVADIEITTESIESFSSNAASVAVTEIATESIDTLSSNTSSDAVSADTSSVASTEATGKTEVTRISPASWLPYTSLFALIPIVGIYIAYKNRKVSYSLSNANSTDKV